MKPDLSWQIDDDEGDGRWEPAPRRTVEPRRTRRYFPRLTRRGWLIALAVVAALIALPSGWALWRARQAQEDQRAAVSRLARLEDQLAQAGDLDALRALQDPRYTGWTGWTASTSAPVTASEESLAANPLSQLFAADGPSDYGPVQLDGNHAELTVTQRYLPRRWAGRTLAAFTLRSVRHYRLVDGGWLRSDPPDTGVDITLAAQGPYLISAYPLHDAAVVQPLLTPLDFLANRACIDLGCADANRPPVLVFTTDPQAVVMTRASSAIYVPAPSLIGMPDDAAGVEALYRLYAFQLVTGLAENVAGARAAEIWPWLQWEMAQLGLEEPLSGDARQRAARQALTGEPDLVHAGLDRASVWLALDFLAQPNGNPLRAWFAGADRPDVYARLVEAMQNRLREWWAYLQRTAAVPGGEPGNAQLALACGDQVVLWSAATGALSPLAAGPAEYLQWSPDGQQLVIGRSRTSFSVLSLASGLARDSGFAPRAWAPDGTRLIVQYEAGRYSATRSIWSPASDSYQPLTYGPGWAAWSADGRRLAYAGYQDGPKIFVAGPNGQAPRAVADGTVGAWSPGGTALLAIADTSRLGALVTVYDPDKGLVYTATAQAGDEASAVYALAWAPPAEGSTAPRLAIASYAPNPSQRIGRVQVIDVEARRVVAEWRVAGAPYRLEWLPASDRLSWATFPDGTEPGAIYVAQPFAGSIEEFAKFEWPAYQALSWSWSPDGRWLALDNGSTVVWSADGQVRQRLPAGCNAPAWKP